MRTLHERRHLILWRNASRLPNFTCTTGISIFGSMQLFSNLFIVRRTMHEFCISSNTRPIRYILEKGIGLLKLIACRRDAHTHTQTRAQTGCDLSSGCTTAAATAVPLETTSEASGAISRMSINTIFQFRLLQQSRLLFCWHEIAISYIDVTLYMYAVCSILSF